MATTKEDYDYNGNYYYYYFFVIFHYPALFQPFCIPQVLTASKHLLMLLDSGHIYLVLFLFPQSCYYTCSLHIWYFNIDWIHNRSKYTTNFRH